MRSDALTPLEDVTVPVLTTAEYAAYLRLSPQRVREQACVGACAVQPLRVGGRLLFPTAAVRKLLGVEPRP